MKRCDKCGLVAFDECTICLRCESTSFMRMSTEEVSLSDAMAAAHQINDEAIFEKPKCLSLVSDYMTNSVRKKEIAALKAAFDSGACRFEKGV